MEIPEQRDSTRTTAPHIPGYTPSRLLGRGGTSTVWLATRDRDGVRFAIKCVEHRAATPSPTQRELGGVAEVFREARVLATLRHDHLVQVHDVVKLSGAGDGSVGMVMDYAAGGSLANLMGGRGKLGVGETVTILTPVAQALAYLHAQGTVHGDISPGNVLFTAEGKPLVADLGFAATVGESNHGLDAGTPGFVDDARHGAIKQEALQPQRDIYSLAALGWYCLTGMAPEATNQRPPLSLLVPDVPKGLAVALEAGLDPDAHARPTARELARAIYRSAAPEPVDLTGSVHPSVIPELLTRRDAGGRPPRRKRPLSALRRLVPLRPAAIPRTRSRGVERQRAPRAALGFLSIRPAVARGMLVVVAGVLLGVGVLSIWQANQTAGSAADETKSGTKGVAVADAHAIPDALSAALHSDDPATVVAALSAVRDLALAERRFELLDLINLPGSPAEAADATLKQQLEVDGIRLAGLETTLSGVTVVGDPASGRVQVDLTAQTSGYEERDASNTLLRSNSAGKPEDLRLVLEQSDGHWKLFEILAPG